MRRQHFRASRPLFKCCASGKLLFSELARCLPTLRQTYGISYPHSSAGTSARESQRQPLHSARTTVIVARASAVARLHFALFPFGLEIWSVQTFHHAATIPTASPDTIVTGCNVARTLALHRHSASDGTAIRIPSPLYSLGVCWVGRGGL